MTSIAHNKFRLASGRPIKIHEKSQRNRAAIGGFPPIPTLMLKNRPCALVVDRDEENRRRIATLLRQNGLVAAAFEETRGALAAVAAGPADLAVIAGLRPGGSDALAAARQLRRHRPECRVLFIGTAGMLPGDPDRGSASAVTRPFDERRFLGALFELLTRDSGRVTERLDEAELGLIEAQLACLYRRQNGTMDNAVALDLAHQIRDAMAMRRALLPSTGVPA